MTVSVLSVEVLSTDVPRAVGLLVGAHAQGADVRLAVEGARLRGRVVKLVHEGVFAVARGASARMEVFRRRQAAAAMAHVHICMPVQTARAVAGLDSR